MTFSQAVSAGFAKYSTFSGRASRSEFWFWVLFGTLAGLVATAFDVAIFGIDFGTQVSPLNGLVNLALLVPSLAVGARRFHDMDRTGWWQLLVLTGIGAVVLLVWWCFRGTDGPNRYGPDPLAPA